MGVPGERTGYRRRVKTGCKRLRTHRFRASFDRGQHCGVLLRAASLLLALSVKNKGREFVVAKGSKVIHGGKTTDDAARFPAPGEIQRQKDYLSCGRRSPDESPSPVSARFLGLLLNLFALLAAVDARAAKGDPRALSVPGFPDAYYVPSTDPHANVVLVYLHARGSDPARDCRAWAHLARRFAWTLCPQGPGTTASGGRTWNNDAVTAERITDAAFDALRNAHPGRFRARGNVLVGFSEGAFVLQQIGIRDPARWSRWLVLAASDCYWDGAAAVRLASERDLLRRVFLLTGERDAVAGNTREVKALLDHASVPVRMRIVPGLGHELATSRLRATYRAPLRWLFPKRRATS
jgi:predicted esterase